MRRRRRRRPQRVDRAKPTARANEQLSRLPLIRVIGPEGEHFGNMTPQEGIERAQAAGLDLVEVNPKALPPVCRIIDFSKFKYQLEKERRTKKSKKVEVKGVRISIRISENDLLFKARQADKFMAEGHKVRIELILRGRERENRAYGMSMFNRFIEKMETPTRVESTPKPQRLGYAMVVARTDAPPPTEEEMDDMEDSGDDAEA